MKENINLLISHHLTIVNLSLSTGSMDGAKLLLITPFVRNMELDRENLKSYRTILNLTFAGQLTERVVLRRLNNQFPSNRLNAPWHSGYKKNYSTEILQLRLVNDLHIVSEENVIGFKCHL